jgi:hypothetical protein
LDLSFQYKTGSLSLKSLPPSPFKSFASNHKNNFEDKSEVKGAKVLTTGSALYG